MITNVGEKKLLKIYLIVLLVSIVSYVFCEICVITFEVNMAVELESNIFFRVTENSPELLHLTKIKYFNNFFWKCFFSSVISSHQV